jgi:hypothetical protein
MKSKKIKIGVLLILSILVWSLIIYKVLAYRNTNTNDKFVSESNNPQAFSQEKSNKKDSLILNYPDPFLKSIRASKNLSNRTENTKVVSNKKSTNRTIHKSNKNNKKLKEKSNNGEKSIEKEFNIEYLGIARTNENNSSIILTINGIETIIDEKNQIENISVLKIHKDSIIINTSSGVKCIKRKE